MLRRRLVALTLVLSSSFIGSVALLPASPASAKTVTVKAPWASPGNPIGTEVITLRGSIGRTIPRWARLERRTGGRWVFVRRARLARTGGYAFPVAMPASAQSFRVVSGAVRGPRGRVWAKRISRVRTVYRAIQTANVAVPQQMRVGTPATIGLAFAPARPGRPAALQVNENGTGWRTVANLAQDRSGRAAYAYVPPTNGTVEFRAVALASAGAPQLTGPAAKGFALPTTRMKVAAHRGFSNEFPENTLLAYDKAINQPTADTADPALSADWLETDFQLAKVADTDATCADGTQQKAGQEYWIAMHNAGFLETTNIRQVFPYDPAHPEVNPQNAGKYTANGIPLVRLLTLCEIKQLDAGSWKNPANPDFIGLRVPTLEETLDLVRTSKNSAVKLMIEPKLTSATDSVKLYNAIVAYDTAHQGDAGYQPFVSPDPASHDDRALFDTFDIDAAKALVAQPGAEVAPIADTAAEADDPNLVPGSAALLLADGLVTKARVDAAHAANPHRDVIAWTVNDQNRWLELASLRVDGVVTDKSRVARTFLTGID